MGLFGIPRFIGFVGILAVPVSSQTLIPGAGCNKPVQKGFDLQQYLGTWHEIQRSYFVREEGGTCISALYSDIGNGSIEVFNTQISQTGEFSSTLGYANLQDPNADEAKILVNFPTVGSYNATYWVMDTDYNNYSIVWSCRPNGESDTYQILWFLSRIRNPTKEIRDKVHNSMNQLGLLDSLTLEATNQTDCYLIL